MNLWINGRLSAAVSSDLSCEAYKRTLYQPYSVHVQRNSAEVINGATTQIASTVSALRSFLQFSHCCHRYYCLACWPIFD